MKLGRKFGAGFADSRAIFRKFGTGFRSSGQTVDLWGGRRETGEKKKERKKKGNFVLLVKGSEKSSLRRGA